MKKKRVNERLIISNPLGFLLNNPKTGLYKNINQP